MHRTLWYLIGAGISFGVAAALFLRASSPSNGPALALTGLAPFLVGPLVVLVACAWITRSALLRLSTAGLWVVWLATVPSVGAVAGCGPEAADDGIVLVSHNVRHGHGDPVREADLIEGADADVVVLQEADLAFLDELAGQPWLSRLRYRTSQPREGATGLAVWSRWPLDRAVLDDGDGNPTLTVEVATPSGPLTVVAVHTTAPVVDAHRWRGELRALAAIDRSGPMVLAGDFNATADHAPFREIQGRGWTDAHDRKGCGLDATWPRGRFPPFALLRLDHVLVSEQVEVLALEVGADAGSDHAAVVTTLRLSPAPTPGTGSEGGDEADQA